MPEEDVNIEDSSTSDKTVPYSRFKEVNEKAKLTEQELQLLKNQTTGGLTPEQQKEQQAKNFLKGLVREELKAEEEARKAAATKEQEKFESDVDDIIAVNSSVDRSEFLKFIEGNSEKYGITTVKGAMKLYKDLNQIKDETVEQTKESLAAKPKLPKSKGTSEVATDYSEDKNKSYEQIVAEVIAEAETKGQK